MTSAAPGWSGPDPDRRSWARDSGPVFVRNDAGAVAAVSFRFNAWGAGGTPTTTTTALRAGGRTSGMPVFGPRSSSRVGRSRSTVKARHDHRAVPPQPQPQPHLDRGQIEQGLRDYLGVSTIVWLERGHSLTPVPLGPTATWTAWHASSARTRHARGRDDPSSRVRRRASQPGGAASAVRCPGSDDRGGRLDPGPRRRSPSPTTTSPTVLSWSRPVVTRARSRRSPPWRRSSRPRLVGVPGGDHRLRRRGAHCITQQIPVGDPAHG